MEHSKSLSGESASPPKFVQVAVQCYLPESSNWLQGVCESHGLVFIQFVSGSPPPLAVGSILSNYLEF